MSGLTTLLANHTEVKLTSLRTIIRTVSACPPPIPSNIKGGWDNEKNGWVVEEDGWVVEKDGWVVEKDGCVVKEDGWVDVEDV